MRDPKSSATVTQVFVHGSAHTGLGVCGQCPILQPGKAQRLEAWIL